MGRRRLAKKLARLNAAASQLRHSTVQSLEDLVAAYYAMRDPETPLQARAALAFGLLYFLWIVDIIPDFLGLVGYADDGTVLTTIILQVGGAITDTHRAKARKALGGD